jgi:hypothetical protein
MPQVQSSVVLYEPGTAVKAQASSDKLNLGGIEAEVPALKLDGYNYLKIRDFAALLSGTDERFSVEWDPLAKSISIFSGKPYTPTPDDLSQPFTSTANSVTAAVEIVANGKKVKLQSLNANGYNYFPLRDLAELLGYEVSWEDGIIALNKGKP